MRPRPTKARPAHHYRKRKPYGDVGHPRVRRGEFAGPAEQPGQGAVVN